MIDSPLIIPVKLLSASAKAPVKAKVGDAAYDLYADAYAEIYPGRRALVATGVSMAIPDGYYGRMAGRSGLAAKHGIDVIGGVIDSSYRGDLGVILINLGVDTFMVRPGDRIAQLVIERCYDATFGIVDELPASERGATGYGSSGA